MTTPITNHVQLAVDRLIEQYRESASLQGLISALVQPLQDLEDSLQILDTGRGLETATGVNLDGIGSIVGIDRISGQSDDAYRIAIKTKIVENVSNGEPERLITLYSTLVGASMVVLDDIGHGEVGIMSDVGLPDLDARANYFQRLKRAAPVGVRIDYIGSFDLDEPFAFDGLTVGSGFGSTSDAAVGGKFATIYIDNSNKFAFDGSSESSGGFGTILDPLAGGAFIGL